MKLEADHSGWLSQPDLQTVFDAIEAAGGEVRVAGGAVRNSLMGLPVADIDLSTTLVPDETIAALEAARLKAVPTGYEHGTITAVSGATGYEITSLREDIETFGRHAVVRFGTDWVKDAERRDLTMNALYCERDGTIHDPLSGLDDLNNRTVRFIGEADARIGEDYLRILRFFRFFAEYGAGRPDGAGLKACAKLKDGLAQVSVEQIWMELQKLLGVRDPSRALLWMRTTGVLSAILPESEKWGIDLIPALIRAETAYDLVADPLSRIEAMIRPDGEVVTGLARRLKLSNRMENRLRDWAMENPVDAERAPDALAKRLYWGKPQGIADRLTVQLAGAVDKGEDDNAERYAALLKTAKAWQRPVFPISGKDLLAMGHAPGEGLGKALIELEQRWVDSNFKLDRKGLLEG